MPDLVGKIASASEVLGSTIRGKKKVIDRILNAVIAGGHILVEDVPGVGKTTLARSLAQVLGGSFRRVQFTSDMLPSDILGVTVYSKETDSFRFHQGAVFANFVLADEINRTSPRTQSALLEAMSEHQVTIDGDTQKLPELFVVIATQNPVEQYGTYPLPESQLDRFAIRINVGYPDLETETRLMTEGADSTAEELANVMSAAEVLTLQNQAKAVRVEPTLASYATQVVTRTRSLSQVAIGISTRGALSWRRIAQAKALMEGRDFCVPDDFVETAVMTLSHRLVFRDIDGAAKNLADELIASCIKEVELPK